MSYVNRPYQEQCLNSVVKALMAGLKSGLCALPTGAGKTVVLAQLRRRLVEHGLMDHGKKVLLLAHRDELLDQAADKISRFEPSLRLSTEKAERHADEDCDVVLASVQTLGRGGRRLGRFSPDDFGLIITDEAHHAAATSYRVIYDHFASVPHVGFTATPFRGDSKSLSDVYEEVFFQKTMKSMIDEGWLARPIGYRRDTRTDISKVNVRNGEYVAEELENAVDNDERNELILHAHLTIGEGERSMVNCVGIRHGQNVTNMFRAFGIEAAFIHGDTPRETREAIRRDFRTGTIRVLVNVNVLSEGFDEPLIKNIIMARPTRSQLVYVQQLGRGLRIPELGSVSDEVREMLKTVNIIDIADSGRAIQTMGLMAMFGINREIDHDGKDAVKLADDIKAIEKRGLTFESTGELDELKRDDSIFDVPKLDKFVRKTGRYAWMPMSDGSFVLPLPDREQVQLQEDVLGRVILQGTVLRERIRVKFNAKSVKHALAKADQWLYEHYPRDERGGSPIDKCEWFWLADKRGRAPATEQQLNAIKRFKAKLRRNLTKAEASMLLSRLIALHTAREASRI